MRTSFRPPVIALLGITSAVFLGPAACSESGDTNPSAATPEAGLPGREGGAGDDAATLDDASVAGARLADARLADADADAGPPGDFGPAGDFRTYADNAAAALQRLYDPNSGLFPSTGWWNSANALTALIDYSARTGSTKYVGNITITFDHNASGSFLNKFYDDEGWWALAWIDAYDLTKDARYLTMAKTIFSDMIGAWDATCGGGIWWSKDRNYKNAIANELFFLVAVRLHQRTPGDNGAGSFLEWTQREWTWFAQSGMINASNLVNDGLTSTCTNNNGTAYTYNQGVLIGALVDYASVSGDPGLLARAQSVADATLKTVVDDQGVLREPCEPSCGGDGPQFKGIFQRHLGALAALTKLPRYQAFLATNADWIGNAASDSQGNVGVGWSQSFDQADGARQGSALDALVAALPLTAPVANSAVFKQSTANATCTPDQTATRAFDGTTKTKWCGGATAGAYWLQVDLGASTPVGRVVLRHAGAGGEKTAWNTKDFKLRVGNDGSTWTDAVTVTGNTRSVTIHRVVPAATTRYLRLEITAPQSELTTVAARIDELEVYVR